MSRTTFRMRNHTERLAALSISGHEPLHYEGIGHSAKRVYFALDINAGLIKIGVSTNPGRRMKQLSRARGCDVELLGTLNGGDALETVMHSRFKPYRREGEWFSAEILPEALALIEDDRAFYDIAAA